MKKALLLGLVSAMLLICLTSCGALDLDVKLPLFERRHTEHTFEYVASEYTHQKAFTCGCPTPDIAEEHYDHDGDLICDACSYIMPGHVHTKITSSDEMSHSYSYTCGCPTPPNAAAHLDGDGDGRCDTCNYQMSR